MSDSPFGLNPPRIKVAKHCQNLLVNGNGHQIHVEADFHLMNLEKDLLVIDDFRCNVPGELIGRNSDLHLEYVSAAAPKLGSGWDGTVNQSFITLDPMRQTTLHLTFATKGDHEFKMRLQNLQSIRLLVDFKIDDAWYPLGEFTRPGYL